MTWSERIPAVLSLILLAAAAVWALWRKGMLPALRLGRRDGRRARLTVVERVALTAQHSLHLVRVGDRAILVATHPAGVAFEPGTSGFAGVLEQALAAPGDMRP